ncbi:hypothetical protein DINO107042_00920 [Dichelobacter nodosus]
MERLAHITAIEEEQKKCCETAAQTSSKRILS